MTDRVKSKSLRLAFFLPHIGVTGGLGVHCRTLVESVLELPEPFGITIIAPKEPERLFPKSGLEPGWRHLAQHNQVRLELVDWPSHASLADPLDQILAPLECIRTADVIYSSYYTAMARPPAPQVVTFHDAGFLEHPEGFGGMAETRRKTLDRVAPAIRVMHCVSADARDRICRLLPFNPSRTGVVWHALADLPEAMAQARGNNWKSTPLWPCGDCPGQWGRFAFFPVGAATGFNRRRKNVPLAVQAFRAMRPTDLRLVIASTCLLDESSLEQLLPEAERARGDLSGGAWRSNDGKVLVLPNLNRPEFLAAMANALVVYYPTRYEGFGLPAIEAMALGVPLITGNTTSLPEIVGEAGVLVDPDSLESLANALELVSSDSDHRSGLIAKGLHRVTLFSRTAMAQGMVELFLAAASTR